MKARTCRFCGAPLNRTFADLGLSPLANSFVPPERSGDMEPFYPLHAYVCDSCRLVQLEEFETPQHIFGDYLYFSSYSQSWLKHAEAYAEKMIARFGFDASSHVVELASNDGYLLQYFLALGVPVLGVEPAANVAQVAIEKGIATDVAFFGVATAERLKAAGQGADLIAANNVLAHVPDINDFVAGIRILLKPQGVVTVEFPHLLNLIAKNQFDTIYHEHFSYLSLLAVERVFAAHGLTVFDVEELSTHGGSLRLFARHAADATKPVAASVGALLERERAAGLDAPEVYDRFAAQVVETKLKVLEFFIAAKRAGKRVAAYGAAAKGNTLLNYCGVGRDLIDFAVDLSPHKQGLLLPGTRIPVRAPEAIFTEKPDYVLILPWNLKEEIMAQMAGIRDWGGKFVVPIPALEVL